MIDTLTTQMNGNAAPVEETLRLQCPECGGGLNLKRCHLGIVGECVHCRHPIRAVEEGGVVHLDSKNLAPPPESAAPAPASTDPMAMPIPIPFPTASLAEDPVPAPAPPRESTEPAATSAPSMWSFPEPKSEEPSPLSPTPLAPATEPVEKSAFAPLASLAASLPNREADDLFTSKIDFDAPMAASETKEPGPVAETLLFGARESFPSPIPSPFKSKEETSPLNPGWGTKIPSENHASLSPFGTGSAASGGGFAETLFREKVVKESGAKNEAPADTSFTPFSPVAATSPTAAPAQEQPRRDSEEKLILDGDGRPLRPMSKNEEADFATNFFKYENTRSTPPWVKRLRKMALRALILFCLVGGTVAGFTVFAPKETVAEWKEKVIEWLEPGMAIFDYLPESLRPDWLPQTDFGIDGGLDENGQPKKKMNAFEGLDKLKGDVGNMRGAAEAEMEKLKEIN